MTAARRPYVRVLPTSPVVLTPARRGVVIAALVLVEAPVFVAALTHLGG